MSDKVAATFRGIDHNHPLWGRVLIQPATTATEHANNAAYFARRARWFANASMFLSGVALLTLIIYRVAS